MKLGSFAMPLHPPGSDFSQTLADDLDQIVVADQLGLTEYWIGEHFTAEWENIPAPDLLIAQALGVTKNIILGTGVSCLPNHHPFVLAHRIAQLDHMAKGRLHWGVGTGGFAGDLEVFGYGPEGRDNRRMTQESIQAVLDIWDGADPGLYEGGFFSYTIPEPVENIGLRLHVKPYQQPHPPIGVAGVSDYSSTLKLAGREGWIPMSTNLIPASHLKTHWAAVEEGATSAGKTTDRSIWRIAREIFVADTTEEALDEAINGTIGRDFRDYFLQLLPDSPYFNLLKTHDDMPDADVTAEYMAENVWIVGSPDEVEARLRKLYADVGGFGVLLVMAHEWEPRDKWLHSIELLARDVMPRLADLA